MRRSAAGKRSGARWRTGVCGALLSALTVSAGWSATTAPPSTATPGLAPGTPVAFGDAPSLGGTPAFTAAPLVGMTTTPSGNGYWIVGADGGIFTFGDAVFYGSMGEVPLAAPVVGMAATPDGHGYWEVGADGGIFTFGDARFYGSMGGVPLAEPVVGMAATPDGRGYWEVAADGGIFTFGDATFYGSMGGVPLDAPVVGMTATPTGHGYLEVGADGGVFTFGDARFYGSAAGLSRAAVVGIASAAGGNGYWLASAGGGVFSFGDAPFCGSLGGGPLPFPVVALVPTRSGGGYWLLPSQEPNEPFGLVQLGEGAGGPAVVVVQQELSRLGYWLGPVNGSFDDATQQAIWALQKAADIPRSGVTDPATYTALAEGVVPSPQAMAGYGIQVDVTDDLVMFVDNNQVLYTLNTSTGGGYVYGDGTVAITPQGHFDIYNAVNGLVVDSLGALWRPRYFTGGYAIHGDTNVPPVPVSHGCVRVSDEAIDWIWTTNLAPIGTPVWIY